jgi:hypothetical protein
MLTAPHVAGPAGGQRGRQRLGAAAGGGGPGRAHQVLHRRLVRPHLRGTRSACSRR